MTTSKQKGTKAETAVVRYLQEWWPKAERRALSGNKDKGDVAGIPNLVIEVKAAATQRLTEWQRETLTERDNADVDSCLLVVKRAYKPVAEWDAYMPHADLVPGESGWVRMDLRLAVTLLRVRGRMNPFPSLPSSPTTA